MLIYLWGTILYRYHNLRPSIILDSGYDIISYKHITDQTYSPSPIIDRGKLAVSRLYAKLN